jgi:hypothetical protein
VEAVFSGNVDLAEKKLLAGQELKIDVKGEASGALQLFLINRTLALVYFGSMDKIEEKRDHKYWRINSSALWGVLLVVVALTIFAVPYRYRQLAHTCEGLRCEDDNTLLSSEAVRVLQQMGFTLEQYATAQVVVSLLLISISWTLAVILLTRRRKDRMTLLVAFYFILGGFINTGLSALSENFPWAVGPVAVISYLSFLSSMLVYYLFPDGRFVPRWTRWLFLLLAVNELIYTGWYHFAIYLNVGPRQAWLEAADSAIWLGSFVLVVVVQLYRYARVSGPLQRAQSRWVIFGIALTFLSLVMLISAGWIFHWIDQPGFQLIFALVSGWLSLPILLTIGLAILRYRLWDIDFFIRRTLQYTLLTILLAFIYFGIVVTCQGLLSTISGQQSPVVIVFSTLLIAALFNPLRRGLQAFIDRRFYRQKYNAQQALMKLTEVTSKEMEMAPLENALVEMVQETMQPESICLWLKPVGDDRVSEREA